MSKFLKGTMILMMAAFITRILGFVNRIVVARFIGEEGVGLFMMAFPTLILVITITQLGLPVAISKNVAEAESRGDIRKVKKILVVSLSITLGLSIIFTPALILLAPYLTEALFTDDRIYYPLVAIAPIIPIVAISSVIRGYFQGRQNMKPSAYSQVIEQVVRITLIAVLTKTFLPYGIEYAAAAAMVASVLGELASLLYLFTSFKLKKKFKIRRNFFTSIRNGRETFNELMSVALPTTGSRMIGSIAWFFEPIVVVNSLALAGVAAGMATKQYGSLTGYALPLLFLPSFITLSLSQSLVPAISEANSQKNFTLIEHRLQQALRFCLITGGISVVILYVYAKPLMQVMYGSESGAGFLMIMAPFFIFYYYQGPLQAVLQALNLARAAMINSLIGAVVKTGVIFILASQPAFGINGAALGIVTGFMLVTLLHFMTILKYIPMTIYLRDYLKTGFVLIATGLWAHYSYLYLFSSDGLVFRLLFGVMSSTIVYLFLSIGLKLIVKNDLARIPFIRRFITV
ncbi:stage V sporulation protein B [Rossellomorea aquimaris]|jgi:stage V sporulation protein B|uniref:Stage V sporulation protein B n=1 Tax=Rossellomorea aquimaris TaxID=189382 RepID=A0A5D4TRC0_9BACI|nr:stage V sporulation protein B [Rossellomorea aquimaris]TYS77775.1 stage V sporulation protein B [Rossellomorea aquimaris]TYS86957.1 stage V sporulation protein B [Rossellomorea aquimaris]